MTTVFLINGLNMKRTAASDDFVPLRQGLSDKGYKVVPVSFSWRRRSFARFIKDFTALYEAEKTKENIIVGNSFGAVVAFMTASSLKPDKLLLCSLSPFFKEVTKGRLYERETKRFGKIRTGELRQLSGDKIAGDIDKLQIPTLVLYGEKEKVMYPPLVSWAKRVASRIRGSKLIEVPNCPHSMRDPVYMQAIIDLL